MKEKLLSVRIKVEKIESVQVDHAKSKVMVKVKPIDRKNTLLVFLDGAYNACDLVIFTTPVISCVGFKPQI